MREEILHAVVSVMACVARAARRNTERHLPPEERPADDGADGLRPCEVIVEIRMRDVRLVPVEGARAFAVRVGADLEAARVAVERLDDGDVRLVRADGLQVASDAY